MRSIQYVVLLGLSLAFVSFAHAELLRDKIKSNCSFDALKLQEKARDIAESYYAEARLGDQIIANRKAGRPLPQEQTDNVQRHQQLQVKVIHLRFTQHQCLWEAVKARLGGENKSFADLQKNRKAMAELETLIQENQNQLEKIRASFNDCLKSGTEAERRECEIGRHQTILEAVERMTFLNDLKAAWKNSNENHLKKDLAQYSKESLDHLRKDLQLLNDEIVSGKPNPDLDDLSLGIQ